MKHHVTFKVNGTGSLRGLWVNTPRISKDALTDAVIEELHLNPRSVDFIQFTEVKEFGLNKIDISNW